MRKNLFVKPSLQIKYLALVLGAVVITSWLSYFVMESTLTHAFGKSPDGLAIWETVKGTLRWNLSVILSIVIFAIALEHYFFFHGIVGPLVALEKKIQPNFRRRHGRSLTYPFHRRTL